jgi:hypothetical protein
MSDPKTVVEDFYAAFVARRHDDMEALYAPDVRFQDAIFAFTDRAGTMKMWRALLRPGGDATFQWTLDRVDGDVVHGNWVAHYRLGARPIVNRIASRMRVQGGRIVEHEDAFSWPTWAKQAFPLGPLVHVPGVRWFLTRAIRRKVLGAPRAPAP